jgi:4-amino-4-deoxy-L-arabinose transferase-like glycosyltransferase
MATSAPTIAPGFALRLPIGRICVMTLPLVATLLFWAALPERFATNENGDYVGFYEPVARNILDGQGPVHDDGSPGTEYPPGHPIVLAGVFGIAHLLHVPEPLALDALALLCVSGASLMLFLVARTLWGGALAVIPSLAWSTYPFVLWLTKQPNSELPFMVLLFAAVAVFWAVLAENRLAWRRLGAVGVLLGLAMLVRPIAILLPGVFGILLLWRAHELTFRRRLIGAALIGLGALVAVAPWEAWVRARTGELVLLSSNGAASMTDGLTFAVHPGKRHRMGISVPPDVALFMRGILGHISEMHSTGDVVRAVASETRQRPAAAVKLVAIKLARAWYGTDSQRLERPILLLQALYLLLLGVATALVWRAGGRPRELAILCWAVVLYFWFMNIVSLPLVRYMTPAVGLLFLLAPGILRRRAAAVATT